jgi:methionine-rich copper-binding protein CopC
VSLKRKGVIKMRRGLWRKIGIALCIATLALIVCTVGVAAYSNYSVNKPASVEVIAESPATISLYTDVGCKTPLTSIQWGKVVLDGTQTYNVYVHNDCAVAVDVAVSVISLPSAYGTVTGGLTDLASGACEELVLTLDLTTGIPLGVRNFTIRFTASEASP